MTSVFEPLITLGRKPLETEDVPYIVKTINEAGDASAAIVGGIFVEDALTEAIFSRLIVLTPERKQELTRQNGPLSTFDSKITVSRALGLLDRPTKQDLTAIRHIRNAFAHGGTASLSFAAKEVVAVCDSLNWLKRAAIPFREKPTTSREKFSFVVRALVTNFLMLAEKPDRPDDSQADLGAAIERIRGYSPSPDK